MPEKARRDDQDMIQPRSTRTPQLADDEEDRLGSLAGLQQLSPRERREIDDSLDVVEHGFEWVAEAASIELKDLEDDLLLEDPPPWYAHVADGLLQVALGAGSAGIGLYLASKLVNEEAKVTTEFVKGLFEQGINAGVAAGRAQLSSGDRAQVIKTFIKAHKQGVWGTQKANQDQFLHVGRHEVQSVEQARALEAACSRMNIQEAAKKQYEASRDAWVSYLAQATFGAVGKRGPVTAHAVDVGPTTTNMSPQASRDRTNAGIGTDFVPGRAPSAEAAASGGAPGVLVVLAKLPRITWSHMDGTPEVRAAVLNGIDASIRSQYEGTALADLHIPRHIHAQVEGMSDFQVNLDEAGTATYVDRSQSAWLRARAGVGQSEAWGLSDYEQQQTGLAKLLRDLVPKTIVKQKVPW